jgi:Icc-related predicted phosphoesterase
LHGQKLGAAGLVIGEFQPDWIVLLGDILPDFPGIQGQMSRLEAQREYWQVYRRSLISDSAVTTLVRGNHEIEGFTDPELRGLPDGLEGHVVRLEGIPAEFGCFGWSREWEEDQLERELRDQLQEAPEPLIYLTHVPPYGCLDIAGRNGHVGHRPLARHLEERGWPKALVLCGHVHEGIGCTDRCQTLVVNVACGYALIEWSPCGSKVLDLDRM